MVEDVTITDYNIFSGMILLYMILALTTTLLLLYQYIKPRKLPADIPTPYSHFLLGFLPYIAKYQSKWPSESVKFASRYKRTWAISFPRLPGSIIPLHTFFIISETNMKYVLKDNFENYVKGGTFKAWLEDLLGDGIFGVDGSQWKAHRKLLSHMFSRSLLRNAVFVMEHKINVILDKMKHDILLSKEQNIGEGRSITIDMKDLLQRLFFDETSQIAFGVDLNASLGTHHPFFTAFDEFSTLLYNRGSDPLFAIKRKLNIGSEARIAKCKTIVDNFAFQIISERRVNIDQGIHKPKGSSSSELDANFDLLTKYIEHAKKWNEDISDKELRDIVVSVMFAGRDSTSSALSWVFYEIGRNPNARDKIISEVESICRVEDKMEYSIEAMGQLKYTHCVILETLRLHPPIPENIRYAVKSDVLPDGTHIPSGSAIGLSYMSMGYSSCIWGDDAHIFKPERFLGKKEPSQFLFPVFHGGPRVCIGKPLAMINMKLVLSLFLSSGLKFEGEHSGDYEVGLVVPIKGSFPMKVSNK